MQLPAQLSSSTYRNQTPPLSHKGTKIDTKCATLLTLFFFRAQRQTYVPMLYSRDIHMWTPKQDSLNKCTSVYCSVTLVAIAVGVMARLRAKKTLHTDALPLLQSAHLLVDVFGKVSLEQTFASLRHASSPRCFLVVCRPPLRDRGGRELGRENNWVLQ